MGMAGPAGARSVNQWREVVWVLGVSAQRHKIVAAGGAGAQRGGVARNGAVGVDWERGEWYLC
jgi:hypothetical protein